MAKTTGHKTGATEISAQQRSDAKDDDRLKALEIRLQAARVRGKHSDKPPSRGVAMGKAFRLVTELVVGLVVGGAIGWYLDQWLGTTPLLLLVFFVLGVAAGVLNVVRTAQSFGAGAQQKEDRLKEIDNSPGTE